METRNRVCIPANVPVILCGGAAQETRPCNSVACESWSTWMFIDSCSATCGGGTRTRRRECNGKEDFGISFKNLPMILYFISNSFKVNSMTIGKNL